MNFCNSKIKKIDHLVFSINKELIGSKGINYLKLLKDWNFIMGNEFSLNTTPIKITKLTQNKTTLNTLHIAVNNNSLITQLIYQTGIIIEKINFYLGIEYVHKVKFKFIPFKSEEKSKYKETLIITQEQEEMAKEMVKSYLDDDKIRITLLDIAKEIIAKNN